VNTTLFALLGFAAIVLLGTATVAIVTRNGPRQELAFVIGCALLLGVSVLAVRMVNPDVSTSHLVWSGIGIVISGLVLGAVTKLLWRRKRGK
jgi:multidrug transporter EmrE-like cation transporter